MPLFVQEKVLHSISRAFENMQNCLMIQMELSIVIKTRLFIC